MQPLTRQDLARFAPRALPEYVNALIDNFEDIQKAGIDTPLRLACFLGQCAHETGDFTILRENMRYSADEAARLWPHRFGRLDPRLISAAKAARQDEGRAMANVLYANRENLGNLGGEDGWDYRGGGLLQHTGRGCYAEVGAAIGVDLEGNPEMIEDGPVSLAASLYTWVSRDLNRFADRGYVRAIGNAINRGDPYSSKDPIGAAGRLQCTERAMAILGAAYPPADELALGSQGSKVKQLQERLKELGYSLGAADGVFGPATARAVAAFKLDHKRNAGGTLELEELVGPLTWTALDHGQTIQVTQERQAVTETALVKKGSTEVVAGQQAKHAGRWLAASGAFAGVGDLGAVDTAKIYLSQVTALRATVVPALEALQWAFRNFFWVALLIGGVWFFLRGRQIIAARLAAHRSGANLGR